MTQPDRTLKPKDQSFEKIIFNKPIEYRLTNGISVFTISQNNTPLISLSIDIKAGEYFQPQPFVAFATHNLLPKGTLKYSAKIIAEKIASKGADISVSCGTDYTSVNITCMKDKFASLMQYLDDIIKHPVFNEQELQLLKEKEIQHLHLKEQKVDYLSSRQFFKQAFGPQHPMGKLLEEKHIREITSTTLRQHHNNFYTSNRTVIFCAGAIDDNIIQLLEKTFGSNFNGPSTQNNLNPTFKLSPSSEKFLLIDKPDAIQSSLKIGFATAKPNQKEYIHLKILNTIYGGHYSSRLMQNIRQEKGYTYGIYSSVSIYNDSLVFLIHTDTGAEYTQKVIDEIFSEMNRLHTKLIHKDELIATQNWILGAMMRMFDGAFSQMNVYRQLYASGLNQDFYSDYQEEIMQITPKRIKELASQYLNPALMHQVVAGVLKP